MEQTLKENLEPIKKARKRLFLLMSTATAAMFLAIETLLLLKGMRFDIELAILFGLVGLVIYWTFRKSGSELRRRSQTTWTLTEEGLCWNHTLGESGTILWEGITDIHLSSEATDFRIRETELSQSQRTRTSQFRLYFEAEDALDIQTQWKKKISIGV